MKKFFIAIAVIAGLCIAVLLYFSYRPYNVILITIDTLRPDYLSCYNPNSQKTPNIDSIAARGTLFQHAYSLIPITMPSHTAMLTSRSPDDLGIFNNGDRFEHNVPMVTDLLENKGYTTGAFISLGVLGRAFGLAHGFDTYEDDFSHTRGRYYKVASEINQIALPWIEKHRKKKFFAWLHYSDPHEPYVPYDAPPDTEVFINGKPYTNFTLAKKEKITLKFDARPGENHILLRSVVGIGKNQGNPGARRFIDPKLIVSPPDGIAVAYDKRWTEIKLRNGQQVRYFEDEAVITLTSQSAKASPLKVTLSGGVWQDQIKEIRKNYAAEVRYTDEHIGKLWEKLSDWNLLNKTIVIITSDHGEGLKTHGILGHVDKLWNETMHIPFIIYYPGTGHKGAVEKQLVNLLDIMPTILDLLHVRKKPKMDGQSLRKFVSWSPFDQAVAPQLDRPWTYAFTFRPEAAHNAFAITNGQLKVIHTPTKRIWPWEAYDLTQDPIEKRNLAKFDADRFESLAQVRGLLEAHRKDAEAAHNNRKNPGLDPDEQEVLRNLGYVAGQ